MNAPGADADVAPAADPAARAALLGSLRAAIDALAVCADHLEAMIEHADRLLGPAGPSRQAALPSEISHGGGPSPLLGHDAGAIRAPTLPGAPSAARPPRLAAATPAATPARSVGHSAPDVPGRERDLPESSALLVAVDLAHRGYSREEISERLSARWGERAAELLSRVMD